MRPTIATPDNSPAWLSERSDTLAAGSVSSMFTRFRKELGFDDEVDFRSLHRS